MRNPKTIINYKVLNRKLHKRGETIFAGHSIVPHLPKIAKLVERHRALNLLDYGCGKATQYRDLAVHKSWGGIKPVLFDVGVPRFSVRPETIFDGVICTDVMEHIAEEDVDSILQDVITFAAKFVFLSISTVPAKKWTDSGENVHLTVRPSNWWEAKIRHQLKWRPSLDVVSVYTGEER